MSSLSSTTSAADDAAVVDVSAASARLPYGFARRHGVVVAATQDGSARLAYRGRPDVAVLAELRRHLRVPIALEPVSDEEFERLLGQLYESGTSQSMQVMEDMNAE